MLLDHDLEILDREDQCLGLLDGTGAGAVRRVIQEDPFAHGLAHAKRHQPDRARVHALLDGDGTRREDGHEPSRGAFLEQDGVRVPGVQFDQLAELMQRGISDAGKERCLTQLVANRVGHWRGKRYPRHRARGRTNRYLTLPTSWSACVTHPS